MKDDGPKQNDDFEKVKLLVEEIVLETFCVTENVLQILGKHKVSPRKNQICSNIILLLRTDISKFSTAET